jgi:hypothetical protein
MIFQLEFSEIKFSMIFQLEFSARKEFSSALKTARCAANTSASIARKLVGSNPCLDVRSYETFCNAVIS